MTLPDTLTAVWSPDSPVIQVMANGLWLVLVFPWDSLSELVILLRRVGCAISALHSSRRGCEHMADRLERMLQLEEAQLLAAASRN